MSLKKGTKFSSGYATVTNDEGVNYREIADIMSELGYAMNHSSARNYILRTMRKFAEALVQEWSIQLTDEQLRVIVNSPAFQSAICDILHELKFSADDT